MLRVGLTGGIGSGKSEVSKRLAAYGAAAGLPVVVLLPRGRVSTRLLLKTRGG